LQSKPTYPFIFIVGTNGMGMPGTQSARRLGDESSQCSLYKFPALLLVGIGSREQERLADLGTALALAVRYSFDLSLHVRSEREKIPVALGLTSTSSISSDGLIFPRCLQQNNFGVSVIPCEQDIFRIRRHLVVLDSIR